jgi:hypothetical protein
MEEGQERFEADFEDSLSGKHLFGMSSAGSFSEAKVAGVKTG